MVKPWGYMTMLNVRGAIPHAIRCPATIEAFTKQLVKDIDMVAYGKPQIVHFGTGDKAGYTLTQLIETSNITAHFCEESNNFYLDVFSCKPYDTKVIEEVVKQYFAPAAINTTYIERDADLA